MTKSELEDNVKYKDHSIEYYVNRYSQMKKSYTKRLEFLNQIYDSQAFTKKFYL